MNQILLSGIDENYYSKKHLNFKSIESERTYIIDKNKIDYIETISFSVLNQEEKEEIHYQYLTFVGDNVFSFVSNVPEYYEPLLLGAKVSGNAKFNKNSELIEKGLRKIQESLHQQEELLDRN